LPVAAKPEQCEWTSGWTVWPRCTRSIPYCATLVHSSKPSQLEERDSMAIMIRTMQDVVDWGLCTGCGACYYACDKRGVTLVNIESVGIRPRFDAGCESCTSCLSICPGYQVDANLATGPVANRTEADHEFGAALEIWEGNATDPEIRYKGSSGGLLSALALYCLERENMEFVLHSGMDEAKPWTNKSVQSRTRAQILARSASRYAPASPCEGLGGIEQSPQPCVFIGKPCDTTAVMKLRQQRPELDKKLGLVLAFFCAGTPSTQGTVDLIQSLDVPLPQVDAVRYRGEGWPGNFKVLYDEGEKEKSLTYTESWGKLTNHRPLRCNLCPDGLGRVADITCGDAWESFNDTSTDPGRSIAVVRTRRGQEILRRAREAKYVELVPVGAQNVMAAQANLLQRRRELFGRLAGLALLRIPTPRFEGFSLFRSWIRLPLKLKLRTVTGTMWRAVQRGWGRRQVLFPVSTKLASPATPQSASELRP
jgi:coenzyme F420 hydrogenase subunit beta